MMIEKTRFVNTLIRNQNHLKQPSRMASHLNSPSAHEASCGNASGFLVTYWLFIRKYTVLPIHFQRNLPLC